MRLLIKVNVLNVYLDFHKIFVSVPPADNTMGWKNHGAFLQKAEF